MNTIIQILLFVYIKSGMVLWLMLLIAYIVDIIHNKVESSTRYMLDILMENEITISRQYLTFLLKIMEQNILMIRYGLIDLWTIYNIG